MLMDPSKKVENMVCFCSDCLQKPRLWEVSFYGYGGHKFKVECPECGRKTGFFIRPESAISAWNKGETREKRSAERVDNEGLSDMMGEILADVNKEYQRVASKPVLSRYDLQRIQDLEAFVMDNPYMLSYDREYVREEMRRLAYQSRKKHCS